MIFQHTWEKVLSGEKAQTRRIFNPKMLHLNQQYSIVTSRLSGRILYALGRSYSIQKHRGGWAIWTDPNGKDDNGISHNLISGAGETSGSRGIRSCVNNLNAQGYREARIEMAKINLQNLLDITEADALAEGVGSRDEFLELWDQIHSRPGYRSADNPQVLVFTFRLITEQVSENV